MSKAFTRESDESGVADIPSSRPQLPPGARNYITREGADRLKQQLMALLKKKRGSGSNSNEPVPAPETDPQRLESKIRNLRNTLDSVVVAEIPPDPDKVGFGAIARVRHG